MKEIIYNPTGFPYVLFEVNGQYVTACNESQAISTVSPTAKRATPVEVTHLIKEKGHQETHLFLKNFGETWICKNGKIFYEKAI